MRSIGRKAGREEGPGSEGRSAVDRHPRQRFGAAAGYDIMRGVLRGTRAAREMCLTGRSCDAQEALTIGLINRAVEPGELLAAARAAREIAAIPEEMLENAKRGFVAHQPLPFES